MTDAHPVLPAVLSCGGHRLELMTPAETACVTPGNLRSAALLAKLGFTREGLLRDYGEWYGAFHDQELWERLVSDPLPGQG